MLAGLVQMCVQGVVDVGALSNYPLRMMEVEVPWKKAVDIDLLVGDLGRIPLDLEGETHPGDH